MSQPMSEHRTQATDAPLLLLVLIYCAASLLHFTHNAVYLHEYPNLPASLTSFGVYAAWCGVTVVGAIGYWIYRRGARRMGLTFIAVYALFGFGGMDHYIVAPMSAHSMTINTTIWIEALAALALLIFAVRLLVSRTDNSHLNCDSNELPS